MSAPVVILGSVQRAILTVLEDTPDGLTAAQMDEQLQASRPVIDKSVRLLRDRLLIRVLRRQPGLGKAAAVWGISTAGQAALDAAKETAS